MVVEHREKNTFIENIFSIRNKETHKVITIFGIKFKTKSRWLFIKNMIKTFNRLIYI